MSDSGTIEAGVHRVSFRVYYEDTDLAGIVYHANYLKFFERGRSDFLRVAGIDQRALSQGEDGLFFAVRHMDVDFKKPARFDDIVTVESRIKAISGARVVIDQKVTCDGRVLSTAAVTVAALAAKGGPTRLPEAVRTRFSVLQDAADPA
ncbi:MAG: tol-pal system-associated acyl-CoA thioesterase [Hyphomicrobiaceae bacterium]|nr:tol-pal system-associated acyl-CoA thioesterase [Hyphomicrobiaceae bacterium]